MCKFHPNRITRAGLLGAVLSLAPAVAGAVQFAVNNLVTDNQLVNAAQITDADLRNPWGISLSPTSPFWVANNATGLATLYNVAPATNVTTKQALVVSIPGNGSVTGTAFNGTSDFNGNRFLFVSEDGTVSGWRGALGTTAETLATGSTANVYKGVTFGSTGGSNYLYASNFLAGTIDVFKGNAGAPNLAGSFLDPNLPAGYAPFNIQNIGGTLYVTYALQDVSKHDEVTGAGNGLVDAFDLNGNLQRRVATGGVLNAPWGLAIAPVSFGSVAGDLLVGNFGDGRINRLDPITGAFLGQLLGTDGNPITIDGLWALMPGNGGNGGSFQDIYFTAGSNGEVDGLFGAISAVPEPETCALLLAGLSMFGFVARRRKQNAA